MRAKSPRIREKEIHSHFIALVCAIYNISAGLWRLQREEYVDEQPISIVKIEKILHLSVQFIIDHCYSYSCAVITAHSSYRVAHLLTLKLENQTSSPDTVVFHCLNRRKSGHPQSNLYSGLGSSSP